ncbi:MAG: hypothetical protein ACP5N2_07360 [Candidatus Nanoarchaeia archaeon]
MKSKLHALIFSLVIGTWACTPNYSNKNSIDTENTKSEVGTPIKQRADYTGSWISELGLGYAKFDAQKSKQNIFDSKDDPYGELFDLYRYYFGMPLKSDCLSISKHKPSNSKNKNTKYIAINNKEFIEDVLKEYYSLKTPLKIGESTRVSGYYKSQWPKNNTTSALGTFIIGRGFDEQEEYISYYDIFDSKTGKAQLNNQDDSNLGRKSFEIYDRIYLEK